MHKPILFMRLRGLNRVGEHSWYITTAKRRTQGLKSANGKVRTRPNGGPVWTAATAQGFFTILRSARSGADMCPACSRRRARPLALMRFANRVRQQAPQIAITLFGDTAQLVLATTRVLSWDQPYPCPESAVLTCVGGRAPPGQNTPMPCAGSRSLGAARGSRVR